jgi:hypothetical protein
MYASLMLTLNHSIIAITGLDGHAYGSWRGKRNLGWMWLRDFLSKDLLSCRTMIYSYNSKLPSHGIDTIMNYGQGFWRGLRGSGIRKVVGNGSGFTGLCVLLRIVC